MSKKHVDQTNCCVSGCHTCRKRDNNVSFHLFPRVNSGYVYISNAFGSQDKVDRRTAWQNALRMGKPPTDYMRVCGKHFPSTDYIYLSSKKRRLKKTAVPSLNLPKATHGRFNDRHKDQHRKLRLKPKEELQKVQTTDLPNDMENYMEYNIMGSVGAIRMKPSCLPSKFECQSVAQETETVVTPSTSNIENQQNIVESGATTESFKKSHREMQRSTETTENSGESTEFSELDVKHEIDVTEHEMEINEELDIKKEIMVPEYEVDLNQETDIKKEIMIPEYESNLTQDTDIKEEIIIPESEADSSQDAMQNNRFQDWTEKLIFIIQTKPPLYDKTLAEYYDKDIVAQLWTEVFETAVYNWEELSQIEKDLEAKHIRRRWKSLKSAFGRELRKQISSKNDNSYYKDRKYRYFDALLFLEPTLAQKKTTKEASPPHLDDNHIRRRWETLQAGFRNELNEQISKRDNLDNKKHYALSFLESTIAQKKTTNEASPLRLDEDTSESEEFVTQEKEKRKICSDEESTVEEIKKTCDDSEDVDEDKEFLLSLVPSFRKLTADQKLEAKVEFLKVLRRISQSEK